MGASDGQEGSNNAEKPSSPPPPPVGFWELFRFADGLDYVLMAIGTVGAIVHGCSMPVFLRVMAELINSFGASANNPDKMMKEVTKNSLLYLIVGAAVCVSSWAEIACWTWTGERQTTKMRIKFLEAALNQDIKFYDTEIRTSDVVDAVTTHAVTVQEAISEKLGYFLYYGANFLAGFVVGFSAVWRLALVTLGIVPLVIVLGAIYSAALTKFHAKNQKLLSESGNIVEETIAQIRTVYAYVGESRALQAYSAALKILRRLNYKGGLARGIGIGVLLFFSYGSYAPLFWYGGIAIRHHFANGGLVIATMSAIMMGGQSLGQCVPIMNEFAKARASAARIFSIIDHKPDIDRNNDSGFEIDSIKGQVEFKNVDFFYPTRPDSQVLNNLSLTIPAGKTIALVGSSGSGKSTVVSLIERFYEPTSGQVLLDGHNIKTIKLRWLREQIGLVSQEPALFATTIKENILLGKPGASKIEIEEAAKVANAHSFITKLPDGYDTQVGERGLQLSGGQKQRIAIARAMLKDPSILLLDEATSALDSESERLVQEALDRFRIARTTLVIAHRLSTIRKADLVAVLQQGSLVEIGKHDELIRMGAKSIYANLIKIQEATHETAVSNAGKTSARSSARNSFSSPMIAPNSYGRSPIITPDPFCGSPIVALNSSCGRSPYSSQLSELSTPDHSFTLDAAKPAVQGQACSFWRLVKMNAPEWPYALIASIGSVICGAISAVFAFMLGSVLSVYYNPSHAQMIKETAEYCYILIGIAVVGLIFSTVQFSFWDIVGQNLTNRVKEKLFAVVLRNEMAWFDREENQSSVVAARLALNTDKLKSVIGDQISLIMQNFALMLVACTISFLLQWRLTIVLIAVFPFVVAGTLFQRMFTQGFLGNLDAAHAKATQLAGEAIANLRTIAAFNSESKMVSLFTSNLQTPLRRSFWTGQMAGSGYGIAQFSLYASYALSLWYGCVLVKHGHSNFSKIIRVMMVLMISADSAATTLGLLPDIIKGGRAMRAVFELLDHKTQIEPDDPNATIVPGRLLGEVEFKHVQFTYPSRPDVPIFRDLSFHARAGKTLALVGPSGCGKSSAIAMIERFYEPSSGRIMIDGKDIRKYNLKSLRRHIALVPQEPCLFATSIYENIAYGNESATEAEVIEAATLANAHIFISSLPDGYKTFAGERGIQLSGGQKQRIAIARAILKKADIMLLDEATSALDSESERSVQEAIDRACAGKTTIVVAHRLATIRNAHIITVIDEGRVVEQGSDSQLLRNPDGIYARMILLQMSTHGQAAVVDKEFGTSSSCTREYQEG